MYKFNHYQHTKHKERKANENKRKKAYIGIKKMVLREQHDQAGSSYFFLYNLHKQKQTKTSAGPIEV